MAKGVTLKLEGFKELEDALMQLEKESSRKTVVKNALKKAAEPIARSMSDHAARTPDPGLSKSIVSGTKRPKGEVGNAAYAQAMRQGRGEASAVKAMRDARRAVKGTLPPVLWYIGPSERWKYAHWWEFGISKHTNSGIFAGTQHPGVAATPFIRPAWDANKEKALEILADEMRVQIAKAAKRQSNARAKKAKAGS